jgi:RND family efflux transporter MFP subunit
MRIDMNSIKVLAGVFLLSALALGLAACGQTDAKTDPGSQQDPTAQAVAVKIQEVQFSPFADVIQTTGIVKAQEDVMLSPEEGGVVKQWLVKKGEQVKKGQLLGILNDDVITASYDAANAQYNIAQLNFEKQQSVYKEQAISELQFKNAQYGLDAARAQANLMKARLERTRIKSPIDGIFDENYYDEGEFAPPMAPIAHIVNARSIKIAAEVTERYASLVRVGNLVRIVPDNTPEDTLEGRINYVGASVSASNRTLPVEIYIRNPDLSLKPEMITRVSIVRSRRQNAILLDENVVQQIDRGKMVVFVENNGIAEQRVVKLGARQGTQLEIIQGLKPGDRVIISGIQKLVNGQTVTVNG